MTEGESAVALASAYIDARNYIRADQVLREAITASPDSAVLLANLARVQVLTNDYSAAAHTAYAALAISPEYTFAMRMYAVALDGIGWLALAMSVAWLAVCTNPQDHLAHYVYAELLLKAWRPQDALVVVGEALRIDPAAPDSHVLRGQILAKLGRVDESTASYEEALRLDPSHASALNNIGVNRLAGSRWSTALRGFLGAARLDPDMGDLARRNIGVVLARLMRFATYVVAALAYLIILSDGANERHEASALGFRIVVGLGTAALFGAVVWLCRIVPVRTLRSVLRVRFVLVLRLGLVVGAVLVGSLAAVGTHTAVTQAAALMLLLGTFGVVVIGRLTGS